MAGELRGGLSFGLSGFSFWSHDVGGFTVNSVQSMDKNLFARWLAFGMLSSQSRCHGDAPKESWLYGTNFMDQFRVEDAPLMHENETGRNVYLPPGTWIDYQTRKNYSGGWQKIEAGEISGIILVCDGTVIPHIALAQFTSQMDWSKLDLVVYAKDATTAKGLIYLPGENELHELTLTKQNGAFKLGSDPLAGRVAWTIHNEGK